jgi:hypothetical protein
MIQKRVGLQLKKAFSPTNEVDYNTSGTKRDRLKHEIRSANHG